MGQSREDVEHVGCEVTVYIFSLGSKWEEGTANSSQLLRYIFFITGAGCHGYIESCINCSRWKFPCLYRVWYIKQSHRTKGKLALCRNILNCWMCGRWLLCVWGSRNNFNDKMEKNPPNFRGALQSYPKKLISWIWCILSLLFLKVRFIWVTSVLKQKKILLWCIYKRYLHRESLINSSDFPVNLKCFISQPISNKGKCLRNSLAYYPVFRTR